MAPILALVMSLKIFVKMQILVKIVKAVFWNYFKSANTQISCNIKKSVKDLTGIFIFLLYYSSHVFIQQTEIIFFTFLSVSLCWDGLLVKPMCYLVFFLFLVTFLFSIFLGTSCNASWEDIVLDKLDWRQHLFRVDP